MSVFGSSVIETGFVTRWGLVRGHWVQFWEHYDGFVVNASRCVCHHTRGITLREVMVSGLPHADSDASVFIRT